jgi:hypothetical protein
MTLVFTGIAAFLLISYLQLVKSQNYSNVRSQAWNSAVAVIEAGVEEALTQLNVNGITNMACDGWQKSGDIYYMQRRIGDGWYLVTVSNYIATATTTKPIIESRGFVPVPSPVASLPGPVMALVSPSTAVSKSFMGRGVLATTRGDRTWTKGWSTDGNIDMKGNDIATDSFDSSDPNHSTGGRYDPAKNKDNGDIATNSSLTNTLNYGNANIYGRVSTGPKGAVSGGANGSVGDKAWHAAGNKGIQPGYSTDDMNVDFSDVIPPSLAGAAVPGGGYVNGVYYDYVLGNGKYMLGELNTSDKKIIAVGDATLLCSGSFKMSGNASITIATNASLEMYVKGPSAYLGGNGVINQTGQATNFFYFGLPSNTDLTIQGNGTFIGSVYAPNANAYLGGGGYSNIDFVGAGVTKSLVMNGHFNLHYDESLGKLGPFRGFIVTSWNEMTPQQVANLPVAVSSPF